MVIRITVYIILWGTFHNTVQESSIERGDGSRWNIAITRTEMIVHKNERKNKLGIFRLLGHNQE